MNQIDEPSDGDSPHEAAFNGIIEFKLTMEILGVQIVKDARLVVTSRTKC